MPVLLSSDPWFERMNFSRSICPEKSHWQIILNTKSTKQEFSGDASPKLTSLNRATGKAAYLQNPYDAKLAAGISFAMELTNGNV